MRTQATDDPVGYLDAFPDGAVLDAADCNAQFVLTGSHQFKLVERITQSLAGRVALAKLLPLSLSELNDAGRLRSLDLDEVIWRGGYPRAWSAGARPGEVYLSYLETYVERDVRMRVNLKDADLFRRFLIDRCVSNRTHGAAVIRRPPCGRRGQRWSWSGGGSGRCGSSTRATG